RRPITRTVPGTQIRDLSLRSTSVHIVSSDSSFDEDSNFRICVASLIESDPRGMVPAMGQVSTRLPETRTYISGDAPIRYSLPPRLIRKPYGAGFRSQSVLKTWEGGFRQGSKNF